MSSKKLISVVVPVYNEEGNITEFNKRLIEGLQKISNSYEIIYVDDGSLDGSYNHLYSLSKNNERVELLKFDRNYGQTFALRAGLDYSKGDVIIFIDSDLQNDPRDIPSLLDKVKNGYDVAVGWRKKRKDNFFFRVLPSLVANKLISLFLGLRIHDVGCGLKVYRRKVLNYLEFYGEIHRVLPLSLYLVNRDIKIAEVEVKHHLRTKGHSKYGMMRVFKIFLDIISVYFIGKYSTRPMYFFGFVGLFFLSGGFLLAFFVVYRVIFLGGVWVSPLLFISVMLTSVGVEVVLMGVLSAILMRLYYRKDYKAPYTLEDTNQKDKDK